MERLSKKTLVDNFYNIWEIENEKECIHKKEKTLLKRLRNNKDYKKSC